MDADRGWCRFDHKKGECMRLSGVFAKIFLPLFFVLLSFGVYFNSLQVYFLSDDFIWLLEASKSDYTSLLRHFVDADGFFL